MRNIIDNWKKEENSGFGGWDFSHLKKRKIEEKLPWDYIAIAKKLARKSKSVLDMGTGGGEIFLSLAPFSGKAAATEGYEPNYLLAKKRLEPIGVKVINFANASVRKLPFQDNEFDLVLNRHDAFDMPEIYRILQNGGTFLTQQVAGDNLSDLIRFFDAKSRYNVLQFREVRKKLIAAGFTIKFAKNWKGKTYFKDVGALVYFLKNIPWIIEGFGVDTHLQYLQKLQKKVEKRGKLTFTESRYVIQAEKLR